MSGEILPVTVHGSSVKMYPEKFPGIILAAFMKIGLAAVEKNMVACMQGKMSFQDVGGTAACQYNKEKLGFKMGAAADVPVAAFQMPGLLHIEQVLAGKGAGCVDVTAGLDR